MKQKGLFRYAHNGNGPPWLTPVDSRAHNILAEMYPDKKALVWVHTARYPEHHRFAFAVMQKIANACGVPVEIVLLSLKHETGRFDYVQLMDGRVIENPHSIKFESMDQPAFQKFWDDALEVIKDKWLGKINKEDYEEIREMIAGKVKA
jgi:hypothetical protein